MSLLSSLKPADGSTHYKKRVGRGNGSGLGGTAGKGHKGQKARSGGKVRWGFEGGQMPLHRRSPKFGFKNTAFKNSFEIVNLSSLNLLDGNITPESLKEKGLVHSVHNVKILGNGDLSKAIRVRAHKFSASAKLAIEKAGGTVEVI